MIDVAEAERLVLEAVPRLKMETCRLSAAAGRILREEIADPRPAPPFDRVTMDGIALAFKSWERGNREFSLIGTHPAGEAAPMLTDPGACFEVMTGAILPRGCDTVVPVEQCSFDDKLRVKVTVGEDEVVRGQCIHRRGSDHPPGEILLRPGQAIGPREAAAAASAGRASVIVSALPRAALFSSGDELVEPGEPIQDFQIFRSNAYALEAALTGRAEVEAHHVPDNETVVTRMLEKALAGNNLVVISGGVSKGRFDFIHTGLEKLGARKVFHGVRQRPGKPFWFGVGPAGQPVFALPGNPLSTLVCLHRYLLPALDRMAGANPAPRFYARLSRPVSFAPPLTWLLPVKTRVTGEAVLEAEPLPPNTSGDFTSVLQTDGFIELPAGQEHFPQNFVARFFPWEAPLFMRAGGQ